jgi:putative tryptophan/tyrosine transport system substrate-binding protein
MDRRQFLLAVPCGALLPSLALAQESGRVYRMAVISPAEGAVGMIRNLQIPELARLGFVVGRNLTLTTHFGPPARMPELARQAIATKPDVVVAVSTVAILAVKEASSTVPIVMSFIGEDPVGGKYVKLPIVFFLDFDDQGKVREQRVYVDVHLIDEQIK